MHFTHVTNVGTLMIHRGIQGRLLHSMLTSVFSRSSLYLRRIQTHRILRMNPDFTLKLANTNVLQHSATGI